jgi:hypothetical protein
MSDSQDVAEVLFDSFGKQDEFIAAAFDPQYTFVLYGGAIRGGKSFAGFGALILLCVKYPMSRWAIVRKDKATLDRNTLPAWNKIKPSNIIKSGNSEHVVFNNGSEIIFFAESFHIDKDLNRWKGLEVNGFLLEEVNELQRASFLKAIERAGTWVVPGLSKEKQPPPTVLGTCNPSQGWVKTDFYEKWKNGTLPSYQKYIPSTIFDNPHLSEDYKNSLLTLPRYEYEVFVLGNWDVQLKTGGEFFKKFELESHVGPVTIDPEEPIHISIDNNVMPYIAVTLWQICKNGERWLVQQVGEVCARDPRNTATSAAREVLRFLKRHDYNASKVFLYGDPTTTARNTIDDDKKTFLDKFTDKMQSRYAVEKRFFRKAPSVSISGDFINEIYETQAFGIELKIGEHCKESINDYIETKENKDGGINKIRVRDSDSNVSYEKNGHLSDTKRYFITKCFLEEYKKYINRFSDPQDYHIAQKNSMIRGGI